MSFDNICLQTAPEQYLYILSHIVLGLVVHATTNPRQGIRGCTDTATLRGSLQADDVKPLKSKITEGKLCQWTLEKVVVQAKLHGQGWAVGVG